MAVMQSRDNRTFIASESLAAAQFKFVELVAGGTVEIADGDATQCVGVLLNNPANTQAATVCVEGKVMVRCGGTITAGDQLVTNISGEAVELSTSSSATAITMGFAYEDGVDKQIIAMELIQGGNATNQS